MSRNYDAADIVDVIFDEYSSAILTATSAEPVAVTTIVEEVGMSPATAYLDTARESRPSHEGRVFRRSVGTED